MVLRLVDGSYVGDSADDLPDFLRQWGADGYPVHEVRLGSCPACGSAVFRIEGNQHDSTVVRRCCRDCGQVGYIADSQKYWHEEQSYISACQCEEEYFNVAVGFSLYTLGDAGIRSLATAERCVACGKIESLAEWMVRTGDLSLLDRS